MRGGGRTWAVLLLRAEITGAALGLLHAGLLGQAGLYAESSAATTAASALVYAALFLLATSAFGSLGQLLVSLRPSRWKLFPVRGIAVAAYAAVWVLSLSEPDGRNPGLAALALAVALIALAAAWGEGRSEGRVHLKPVVVLTPVLLAIGWLVFAQPGDPPASNGPGADEAPLEALRPRASAAMSPGPWNLLLLTFDTLRADHLGCYGYGRAVTPDLDSLAAAGVTFDNAIVQRPKTSPNVATFLTGTYPARHGIHSPMRRLPDASETLAEILGAAGWRTGAVITNGNLYPEFNFQQGYASYFHGHKTADRGADLAIAWLDSVGRRGEPWHLWVHATDPHWPYSPPEEWANRFVDGSMNERERQVALYDGEIAFASRQTGRILDWLGRNPEVRARTLVVMTADHGESLGEHDYSFEHGLHPYEPSARVPLVFAMPGRIPANERRSAPVGSVDLVPTILDALDLAVPDAVQGRSVLPLVLGLTTEPPRDFVYLEAGYGTHVGPGRTRALRTATSKYVRRLKEWALAPGPMQLLWTFDAAVEGGLAPDEFYDLIIDPAEETGAPAPRELRDRLDAFHRHLARQVGLDAAGAESMDPETEESLRSLGYIE